MNEIPIKVPKKAIKYILFQRTQYLFFRRSRVMQTLKGFLPKRIAYGFESIFSHFNSVMSAEAFFTRKTVARLFSEEMNDEYRKMKAFLPLQAKNILDVGCGVAGMDVLLYKHYEKMNPRVYLLDKTEMPSKVYYSYREKGCYYNSLETSKDILVLNGVPESQVFLQEARDNKIDFNENFDLVVSLISWGFHYPLSTYLEVVYKKMTPGGVLIMDLRKVEGEDPISELQVKFGKVDVIYESAKHARVAVTKKI